MTTLPKPQLIVEAKTVFSKLLDQGINAVRHECTDYDAIRAKYHPQGTAYLWLKAAANQLAFETATQYIVQEQYTIISEKLENSVIQGEVYTKKVNQLCEALNSLRNLLNRKLLLQKLINNQAEFEQINQKIEIYEIEQSEQINNLLKCKNFHEIQIIKLELKIDDLKIFDFEDDIKEKLTHLNQQIKDETREIQNINNKIKEQNLLKIEHTNKLRQQAIECELILQNQLIEIDIKIEDQKKYCEELLQELTVIIKIAVQVNIVFELPYNILTEIDDLKLRVTNI